MPGSDFPDWIRWAVALGQVINPIATIVLAFIAIHTARAALTSAEVAKRDFELSRMPALHLQNLRASHAPRSVTVRGEIVVATTQSDHVGRRAILHRVDIDVEAWTQGEDDEMQVVARDGRTLRTTTRHLYGNGQVVTVNARRYGTASTLFLRVKYTFSGAYVTWYQETWMATATANLDENAKYTFESVSHQFLHGRHYEENHLWSPRKWWRTFALAADEVYGVAA